MSVLRSPSSVLDPIRALRGFVASRGNGGKAGGQGLGVRPHAPTALRGGSGEHQATRTLDAQSRRRNHPGQGGGLQFNRPPLPPGEGGALGQRPKVFGCRQVLHTHSWTRSRGVIDIRRRPWCYSGGLYGRRGRGVVSGVESMDDFKNAVGYHTFDR